MRHSHFDRKKETEIRFDVEGKADRILLPDKEREQLHGSLAAFLERAAASTAPSLAWTDAPASLRSVAIDESGNGIMAVDVQGRPLEIRFEVQSQRRQQRRAIRWKRD